MNLKITGLFLALGLVFSLPISAADKNPAEARPAEALAPVARFNLSFPGGTPAQLAAAIEKASGKVLNLAASELAKQLRLPSLDLRDVTTEDLLKVLRVNSTVTLEDGRVLEYYFSTISDTGIWRLDCGVKSYGQPLARCIFLNLTEYLKNGFTVDDITTVLSLGMRMLDQKPPEMTFHKETRLLVVVGTEEQLVMTHQALAQLVGVEAGPLPEGTARKTAQPAGK
jgi:hypothetical protein